MAVDNRSQDKVLEMLRNIPGVKQVGSSSRFPRSAIAIIAEEFPMCVTEANITMENLLRMMDRVGVQSLLISERELIKLSAGIIECVDEHDYGTPARLGAWDYIRGGIGGDIPGRDLPQSNIFKHIQGFLGGDTDRFRNLSISEEIRRVGSRTKLETALVNWDGDAISHDDIVIQVLASQDDTAVQMLSDRFGGLRLLGRIGKGDFVADNEIALIFIAAYYGSIKAVELILTEILTSTKTLSDKVYLLGIGVAAASYSGQAYVVSFILNNIPVSGYSATHPLSETVHVATLMWTRIVTVLPVTPKRGNAVDTIRAWYAIPRHHNIHGDPVFVYVILKGVKNGISKLDGGSLVNLAREFTLESEIMQYVRESIVNQSPPLIASIPFADVREYLRILDPEINPTITFRVRGREISPENRTPREAIIRYFRYDQNEYYTFLTDHGWNIVPIWY